MNLREHNKVNVEEVQRLMAGENITLFKGEVIRGSSLFIHDVDELSEENICINCFREVAPRSMNGLLATAPEKVRRSYSRAGSSRFFSTSTLSQLGPIRGTWC
ncbi:hypothetical protein IFT47_27000 [Pseudomonas sp. CFBP 13711]|uniref:hypothetical protein n=1 Tax=unclassified Pseudomonas TaxID=196821 RepID=UPI0017856D5B|nr:MULTISPECIES: hypothetical protein [unclassified Pseudomonas]MBD8710275.1 hypothetical protein [Pseudomonas sp. CFBP 13711]MBD8715600.1 hypothetical protein [Pseudomonas sp. CFBP 13715]